jgi:hypothetical protein
MVSRQFVADTMISPVIRGLKVRCTTRAAAAAARWLYQAAELGRHSLDRVQASVLLRIHLRITREHNGYWQIM